MVTRQHWLRFAVLPFLLATASAAQESPRPARAGVWAGAGFGVARNNLKCTGCTSTGSDDAWKGGSGGGAYFAAGRAFSQQVLAGIELGVSGTSGGGRSATLFNLLLVGHYYPRAEGNFYIKGGIGPATYSLSGPYQGLGGGVEASGWAAQVGVGYDIRVRQRFALAPYASIAGTTVRQGSINVSGSAGPVTRLNNSVVAQLGLGLRRY